MDLDRTSLGDRAQDLRTRSQPQPQERTERPADTPQPVQPEHGGALASASVDKQKQPAPDPNAEQRRQRAMDAVSRFLNLPGDTELDIQVDVQDEEVTFQIRDKSTGELIREVPEGEASTLVEKLREFAGSLIDRSF